MKLGTKGRYAVMAMVDLAGYPEDQYVHLQDLSMRQDLPLPYLEQLFSRLLKMGLVKALRGPKGGYTLGRSSKDISIAEIVKASQEEVKVTRCDPLDEKGCTGKGTKCLTHDLWYGLDQTIEGYLEAVSLHDVREGNLPIPLQKVA